jgi:hypothetical protein
MRLGTGPNRRNKVGVRRGWGCRRAGLSKRRVGWVVRRGDALGAAGEERWWGLRVAGDIWRVDGSPHLGLLQPSVVCHARVRLDVHSHTPRPRSGALSV